MALILIIELVHSDLLCGLYRAQFAGSTLTFNQYCLQPSRDQKQNIFLGPAWLIGASYYCPIYSSTIIFKKSVPYSKRYNKKRYKDIFTFKCVIIFYLVNWLFYRWFFAFYPSFSINLSKWATNGNLHLLSHWRWGSICTPFYQQHFQLWMVFYIS